MEQNHQFTLDHLPASGLLCRNKWISCTNHSFGGVSSLIWGFPINMGIQMVKNLPAMQENQVQSLDWEDPFESMGSQRVGHNYATDWRRQWHPTPVLLPGKSHGQRSLVGCSPWGGEKLDMAEWLHFHFSLLCIGEGNGNPLQCSCLENPRDGVAQSRTQLNWQQ